MISNVCLLKSRISESFDAKFLNDIWLIYESVVAFMLKGFFIVVQHFFIFIWSNAIKTLLIVLVRVNSSLISNVFEGAIETCLWSNKSHKVLDGLERTWRNVKSVVPKCVSCEFIILFIFNALLFSLNGAFNLLLFTSIPKISIQYGHKSKSCSTSKLNWCIITGPSLLTAR